VADRLALTSLSIVDLFGLVRLVVHLRVIGPAASSSLRAKRSTSRASRTCKTQSKMNVEHGCRVLAG